MSGGAAVKTSTMKPFAKGDIFLGCTYLNDPEDDHRGEGRILQLDRNFVQKGTLYTEGTRYLIVGCTFAPDGTLWAFDVHDHVIVRVTPDGKQMDNLDLGRAFSSVNFGADGSLYFGEHLTGTEIWQGTTAKRREDGRLGDGNLYKYSPEFELLEVFEAENAPEMTGFKGITHATLHPGGGHIAYTSEMGVRLMRYDVVRGCQLDDLAREEGDIMDRADPRKFIAPLYLPDGRLMVTAGDGLRFYDETGELLERVPLPGRGWAQIALDLEEGFVLASNILTGVAARIDMADGSVVAEADTGFAMPFRSLAGVAVFTG